MTNELDLRWLQRYANFCRALHKLTEAVERFAQNINHEGLPSVSRDTFIDDIAKEGLIQRFEYTHELAWKVVKDFFEASGNTEIYGSRDATREAFAAGLIQDGEVWMDMIKSRNKTSHTYNEATADEIFVSIVRTYHHAFLQFKNTFDELQRTHDCT